MDEEVRTEMDAVDYMMGEETHSPEVETAEVKDSGIEEEEAPAVDMADSAEQTAEKQPESEKAPETKNEDASLKAEIETLQKRLHDTQSAMHKATQERSELQKQLEELKKKESDSDDWFSEDDRKKSEQVTEDLKKSEESVKALEAEHSDIEQKAALAVWDAAAVAVRKEHADYDDVEKKLVDLLDPEHGDMMVRELWGRETDKSPSNAYNFMKKLETTQRIQKDPEGYRKEIEEEFKKKYHIEDRESVTGKDGLDMLNSADEYVSEPDTSGDAVDFLFK